MKFTDFVRKNQNVITGTRSARITESIPISKDREKFYMDEQFHKYDTVESDGKKLRILEKCSNYYACVDESGNIVRKFANALTLTEDAIIAGAMPHFTESPFSFHGYTPSEAFQDSDLPGRFMWKIKHITEQSDDIALLKELKEADKKELEESMETDYKLRDKLTIAKLIADAVGIPHDPLSTPENLVNAAIRKAKKDPQLMRNKAVLANMLAIAHSVGIRFTDSTFEVPKEVDEEVLNEDPLNAWKNRMKSVGAVHYVSGKHPSGSTASKLHAYKIVDGKKVKVGAFDQVGRRGIKEDTLEENKTAAYSHHHAMYLKYLKSGNGAMAKHHADIRDSLKEDTLEELDIETVKRYSEKVKTAPAKSIHQAFKHFQGKERAVDRIHTDELKKMTDRLKESEELVEKFGVFRKGGSIGDNKKATPVKVHDNEQDAKDHAKRLNKLLSPGEKNYYGMKYHSKPVSEGSLTESELKGIRSLGNIVDQRPKGKAVPAQQYKQVDMRDKPCLKCGKGTYGERTFYDDMDGVQRCDKCGHVTKRYIDVPVTKGAKVNRMVGHVKSSEKKLGKSAKESKLTKIPTGHEKHHEVDEGTVTQIPGGIRHTGTKGYGNGPEDDSDAQAPVKRNVLNKKDVTKHKWQDGRTDDHSSMGHSMEPHSAELPTNRRRIAEHIVKHGSGYRLVSKKTGKNLGDFDTMEAAEKHEREVEYFKHKNEAVEPLTLKTLRKKMADETTPAEVDDTLIPDANTYAAKNKEMMGGEPTDDSPEMPTDDTGMDPEQIRYRDLDKKLNRTMVPKSDIGTATDKLPHGNAMNPTSDMNRKQLIRKLQGN